MTELLKMTEIWHVKPKTSGEIINISSSHRSPSPSARIPASRVLISIREEFLDSGPKTLRWVEFIDYCLQGGRSTGRVDSEKDYPNRNLPKTLITNSILSMGDFVGINLICSRYHNPFNPLRLFSPLVSFLFFL